MLVLAMLAGLLAPADAPARSEYRCRADAQAGRTSSWRLVLDGDRGMQGVSVSGAPDMKVASRSGDTLVLRRTDITRQETINLDLKTGRYTKNTIRSAARSSSNANRSNAFAIAEDDRSLVSAGPPTLPGGRSTERGVCQPVSA